MHMSAGAAQNLTVIGLLLKNGVNIEARDSSGETALTLAVWTYLHEVVRVLIKAGARQDIVTNSVRTILHTIAQVGTLALMEALLEVKTLVVNPVALDATALTAEEIVRRRGTVTEALTGSFFALLSKVTWFPQSHDKMFSETEQWESKVRDVILDSDEEVDEKDYVFEPALEYQEMWVECVDCPVL
jgi:hypothetical protein